MEYPVKIQNQIWFFEIGGTCFRHTLKWCLLWLDLDFSKIIWMFDCWSKTNFRFWNYIWITCFMSKICWIMLNFKLCSKNQLKFWRTSKYFKAVWTCWISKYFKMIWHFEFHSISKTKCDFEIQIKKYYRNLIFDC